MCIIETVFRDNYNLKEIMIFKRLILIKSKQNFLLEIRYKSILSILAVTIMQDKE